MQPLSGEYGGRRSVLEQVPFVEGYGVDIGLLIDIAERFGVDSLAQVDLGQRVHRNRPLHELSPMAAQVLQAALHRAAPASPPTGSRCGRPSSSRSRSPTANGRRWPRSRRLPGRPPRRALASGPMHFGIAFANVGAYSDPDHAVTLARLAEEHGFESLWTVEHPVVPQGYESEYPYSREGRMPGPEQSPFPDPLTWLTWVGAHTTTLRLGTGILLLPLRSPVVLAKECATLDHLTGGRMILGIGVGWLREEFDAVGVAVGRPRRPHRRLRPRPAGPVGAGARRPTPAPTPRSPSVYSHPKPVNGTIPVVVGGHSKPAARRAGRLGDGFFPADHRSLPELLPVMRAAAVEAGRDPDAIEITTGGRADVDTLKALADSGVTRWVISPPAMDPAKLPDAIARYADEVIAKV